MLQIPVSADDHYQGDPKATIVLVEYGDYECPHCGHAHPIVKRLQKHFGKRLGFVFRNFPLNETHPNAQVAAEAAEFAAAHQRFWEMHDSIFENQDKLDLMFLTVIAASLELSAADLRSALANEDYKDRVRSDFMGGVRSGVNGTPTFFINGRRHDASFEFDDLVAAIEAAQQ